MMRRYGGWLLGVLLWLGPAVALAGDVSVSNPWTRATANPGGAGAVFMTLSNGGSSADQLLSAASPVAATVELHTHAMRDGVMHMHPIPSIEVPAGGKAVLQPGGLHIMLIDLKAPLKQGETIPLTLTFAKAGTVAVSVSVLAPGASGPNGSAGGVSGASKAHGAH
jgi:copper(I)-binding protein